MWQIIHLRTFDYTEQQLRSSHYSMLTISAAIDYYLLDGDHVPLPLIHDELFKSAKDDHRLLTHEIPPKLDPMAPISSWAPSAEVNLLIRSWLMLHPPYAVSFWDSRHKYPQSAMLHPGIHSLGPHSVICSQIRAKHGSLNKLHLAAIRLWQCLTEAFVALSSGNTQITKNGTICPSSTVW